MKLTLFPSLLTLGLFSTFIMTSCSDDTIEPQKVDVEQDAEVDDLEYSNEDLIDYVMSQFAELNDDGSLYRRTTFFRQMDESDSTAIYTRTATVADARRKFLSLVPESYQKKIIVKNDSAEMSLPMGTSPLMLKYKEGSTDANVLATVQLPSQGAYTKIANTLTMVKSFGANDHYPIYDYLCHFKQFERKVLTCEYPLYIDDQHRQPEVKLKIEKHTLNMLCYDVTDDGMAHYIFIPPLVERDRQLQYSNTQNYLVGHLYPYWFMTPFIEGVNNDSLAVLLPALQKKLKDVLPSPKEVKGFIDGFVSFGEFGTGEEGTHYDKSRLSHYYDKWYNSSLHQSLKDVISQKGESADKNDQDTFEYLEKMSKLLNTNGIAGYNFYLHSLVYPYEVGMYANYKNYPQIPQYVIDNKDKNLPFFVPGEEWTKELTIEKGEEIRDYAKRRDAAYNYAITRSNMFATNLIYVRDKNDVAHVVREENGWEVVDYYDRMEDYFCYFFQPVQDKAGNWSYKPKGRWIESENCFPFRIIYLYQERMR